MLWFSFKEFILFFLSSASLLGSNVKQITHLLSVFFLRKLGIDFYLILAITLLFATSNYLLMPLINKYRDEKQDKKFKYSHFISVVVNFIQMIFLVDLLI